MKPPTKKFETHDLLIYGFFGLFMAYVSNRIVSTGRILGSGYKGRATTEFEHELYMFLTQFFIGVSAVVFLVWLFLVLKRFR